VARKLPQISGSRVVGLLEKLGYTVIHQRGSHVQLRKTFPTGEHRITVPIHPMTAKGTLSDILSSVGLWNGVSRDDLLDRL
jgi:predicted RNA binding protein YcfA (HicA-like mRNA interferase family)